MATILLGGQTDPNGLLDALLNGLTMRREELKKRLIEKIEKTDDYSRLEEAFRLLRLESEDMEVYNLSEDQKTAVNEARQQIRNGQFLTDDEANREIDEWLNSA